MVTWTSLAGLLELCVSISSLLVYPGQLYTVQDWEFLLEEVPWKAQKLCPRLAVGWIRSLH